MHDKEDATTPFYEGQAIHENWEDSDFFTVDGVGHSLQNRDVYKQILVEIQKG